MTLILRLFKLTNVHYAIPDLRRKKKKPVETVVVLSVNRHTSRGPKHCAAHSTSMAMIGAVVKLIWIL